MKKTINNRFAILQLLLIGMLVFWSALDALARQRSVTGSKSRNFFSRKSVTTGNQGNSVVRETQGTRDSGTGTWNKNATISGPNAKSVKKTRPPKGKGPGTAGRHDSFPVWTPTLHKNFLKKDEHAEVISDFLKIWTASGLN